MLQVQAERIAIHAGTWLQSVIVFPVLTCSVNVPALVLVSLMFTLRLVVRRGDFDGCPPELDDHVSMFAVYTVWSSGKVFIVSQ